MSPKNSARAISHETGKKKHKTFNLTMAKNMDGIIIDAKQHTCNEGVWLCFNKKPFVGNVVIVTNRNSHSCHGGWGVALDCHCGAKSDKLAEKSVDLIF